MIRLNWTSFFILTFSFALAMLLIPAPVTHAAPADYKIEVNKATNRLYLYEGNTVKKVYPVATGRTSKLTPEGTFPVAVKINKPGWKGIAGGDPENPLGDRWIGLTVNGDLGRTYGIHGTNQPTSIGKHVSNGCVRMQNQDVIELAKLIPEGTPVWIHSGKSNNQWRGNHKQGLQPASGTGTITGNAVNARTGPSLGAFIITKLNKGTRLAITGTVNDWVQVRLTNGQTAFVYQSYIRGNFHKTDHFLVVNVYLANIRSAPSLSSTVLQRVPKGMILTKTGKVGDFYQIRLKDGSTAYIHETCVTD
ncbi:SH3 domain-containing protein [Thermoactinomyces mirandus]|uniref:SH3 domain-containing protein n=1 Tax=Thermoactinomyces mirandus TaxID=2756294 RepID=A0A7W1XQN2_9BACL|nr:SH3 domain-containing protein [Thermoactinomyces mirandus]MBA4601524.1 SH3 domain-containing protein [Thermoactinomyces mirandus]